jgi:hypothetical protein
MIERAVVCKLSGSDRIAARLLPVGAVPDDALVDIGTNLGH